MREKNRIWKHEYWREWEKRINIKNVYGNEEQKEKTIESIKKKNLEKEKSRQRKDK